MCSSGGSVEVGDLCVGLSCILLLYMLVFFSLCNDALKWQCPVLECLIHFLNKALITLDTGKCSEA